MLTMESARRVKEGMQKGTGRRYRIWLDNTYCCFRVLPEGIVKKGYKLIE